MKKYWKQTISFLSMLIMLFVSCSDSDASSTNVSGNVSGNEGVATKTSDLVVYEVNPLVFASSNALKAVESRLDNIANLGVNVLWIMPIYEQGVQNSVGSPYCIRNFKAINPVMGSESDLKSLVNAAHQRGMKVILDWVANHTSWDNAWISNKSWYTQDSNGNITSPAGFNWSDVADLNYDNTDMRAAMTDAMSYWMNTANIDGFRCDYAEGVPHDYWQEAINKLKSVKGDELLMLAETGDAAYLNDGFDMVYSWDFAYKLHDVFAGKATIADLYATYKKEEEGLPAGKSRIRYITNHDMSSEMSLTSAYGNKEGTLSAFVIATALNGVPLIYSSQEVAYDKALSFFGYKDIDWSANPDIYQAYKSFMQMYKTNEALQFGKTKLYNNSDQVACIYRTTDNQRVLVVANVSGQQQTLKTPIERAGERVKNLLTGESTTLPSSITLDGYAYLVYTFE